MVVVMAAKGYPLGPAKGSEIGAGAGGSVPGVQVFHAAPRGAEDAR